MLKKFSLFMLCGILILGLSGCGKKEKPKNNDDNKPGEVTEPTQDVKNPFTVSEEKGYVSSDYWYYIDGKLTNTTNTAFTYARINYALYDAAGTLITTCFANTELVEANGVWQYNVICPVSTNAKDVASFKMIDYEYNS